jgi:alcohol-forming fatty acyl-CoA reductase
MSINHHQPLKVFKRIMDKKPDLMKKIFPVFGEITKPNLDLSNEHLQRVIKHTEIVFHMAASLKLEASLKPNIIMNVVGTKNAIDLAGKMKNLIQFVHLSTAFCNVEPEIADEIVYDCDHRPEDLINLTQWMSEESMELVQKSVLGVHPNTYTYTKRLAEILVRNEYENLPVCIVRPSIVTPSYFEPLPGWVDSLNGKKSMKFFESLRLSIAFKQALLASCTRQAKECCEACWSTQRECLRIFQPTLPSVL